MDLARFGSKMSYKIPGPTSICVTTGVTVHRLALNPYNNHDRRNEWKHGNKIIAYFALVRAIGHLCTCFKTKDEGTADGVSQGYTVASESAERILRMW